LLLLLKIIVEGARVGKGWVRRDWSDGAQGGGEVRVAGVEVDCYIIALLALIKKKQVERKEVPSERSDEACSGEW
jgi:hypothetical protein